MSDIQINNTSQCVEIENLIKKQENYPYYYWVIWIFTLVSFAVVLSVHAGQELKIDKNHIRSDIKIHSLDGQKAHAPTTIF